MPRIAKRDYFGEERFKKRRNTQIKEFTFEKSINININ